MSRHSDIDIDPITFEVMRSIFEFASDRMATVLQRLLRAMPPLSAPPTAAALSEVAP